MLDRFVNVCVCVPIVLAIQKKQIESIFLDRR